MVFPPGHLLSPLQTFLVMKAKIIVTLGVLFYVVVILLWFRFHAVSRDNRNRRPAPPQDTDKSGKPAAD